MKINWKDNAEDGVSGKFNNFALDLETTAHACNQKFKDNNTKVIQDVAYGAHGYLKVRKRDDLGKRIGSRVGEEFSPLGNIEFHEKFFLKEVINIKDPKRKDGGYKFAPGQKKRCEEAEKKHVKILTELIKKEAIKSLEKLVIDANKAIKSLEKDLGEEK